MKTTISIIMIALTITLLLVFINHNTVMKSTYRFVVDKQQGTNVHDGLVVNSLNFSPDGHILASGSADSTVKIWDVQSGKEIKTLLGHLSVVYVVAFSSDGKLLA